MTGTDVTTVERTTLPPDDESSRVVFWAKWRPLVYPVTVYALSRLMFLEVANVARHFVDGGHRTLLQFLTRWDAGFYLRIASDGYRPHLVREGGQLVGTEHAFFPGYPFVVRALNPLIPGSLAFAAVVVSIAAGGVTAVLLWQIAARLSGAEVADRTLMVFCFFPGTIVLMWPYSEGVCVALCAAAILLLLDDRWLIAAIVTALATATRSNALPVAVACGWVAWNAGSGPIIARVGRALAAFAIGVSGFLAFVVWVGHHVHEPLAWFKVQSGPWKQGLGTWKQFPGTFRDAVFKEATFNRDITVVFCAILVVLLWATLRSRQAGWLKLISLAAFYFSFTNPIAQVSPRLQLLALPAFVAVSERLRGNVLVFVVAALALLTTLMIFAYASPGAPIYMFAP